MASRNVRDFLLRITGDPADAKDALRDVAREVTAFGQVHAEATVDVNTKPADAALAKATADLKKYGSMTETATVDLQVKGAEAQLQRLQQRLDALSKKDASPKVDIQVAKTVAQIERVEARLAALGRRKVDIDVDVKRGALERVGSTITGALSAVGGAAGRGIGGAGGILTGLASGIARLGPLVSGLGILLATVLAPALLAVAASAAAAVAGLALLATTFAVAMGPVVAVAIAVFARFAKVLQAVKEGKEKVAAQAQRVKDATQTEQRAVENLQRAQERAKDAAVEAARAQRQAAEDVSDALLSVERAELSRDQARLNRQKAVQNLAGVRRQTGTDDTGLDSLFRKFTDVSFRPDDLVGAIRKSGIGKATGGASELDITQAILDVRDAKLGEKEANDQLGDSKQGLVDARQKELEFLQQGPAAYEPYKQALEDVATAQDAVRDSQEKLTTARQEQQKALKELDPQERKLAGVLAAVQKALTSAFRPATDRIFSAVINFLKDVQDFAQDTRVRGGLTRIGDAIGDVIESFGKLLRSRGAREGFKEFADGAARMIRALGGRALRDFVVIVGRLARATLPRLLELVDDIADKFDDWEKGTRNGRRVRGVVDTLLDSFDRWRGLIRAVGRLIASVFPAAKKQGDSLLGSLTDKLNEWADWMEKHPEEIKEFFRKASEVARTLGHDLEKIVGWLDKIVTATEKVIGAMQDLGAALATGNEKGQTPESIGGDFKNIRNIDRALADPRTSPGARQRLQDLKRDILKGYGVARAEGGVIPGTGRGDSVPLLAEPGEFVLRRSVAQAIGIPRLNAINAGVGVSAAGSTGMTIQEQIINLPPAPGHGQLGDPRHQAVMLARELRRRGIASVGGGGFGA